MNTVITLGIMMVMKTLIGIGELDSRCFSSNKEKDILICKDFTHKIEHFVQGLDMLSTGRLSQTLIHPRRLLTFLRKVVCDVTMKNNLFHYIQNFTTTMKHIRCPSPTLKIILLFKYQFSLSMIGTVYRNYHRPALTIIFIFPDLLPKILQTSKSGMQCPTWTYACLVKHYGK